MTSVHKHQNVCVHSNDIWLQAAINTAEVLCLSIYKFCACHQSECLCVTLLVQCFDEWEQVLQLLRESSVSPAPVDTRDTPSPPPHVVD